MKNLLKVSLHVVKVNILIFYFFFLGLMGDLGLFDFGCRLIFRVLGLWSLDLLFVFDYGLLGRFNLLNFWLFWVDFFSAILGCLGLFGAGFGLLWGGLSLAISLRDLLLLLLSLVAKHVLLVLRIVKALRRVHLLELSLIRDKYLSRKTDHLGLVVFDIWFYPL